VKTCVTNCSQYNHKFQNTTNLNVSQKSTLCSTWSSQIKRAKNASFTHTHTHTHITIRSRGLQSHQGSQGGYLPLITFCSF